MPPPPPSSMDKSPCLSFCTPAMQLKWDCTAALSLHCNADGRVLACFSSACQADRIDCRHTDEACKQC